MKLTRKMKSREGPSKSVSSFAQQLLGPKEGKQHETQGPQGGSELCSQRHSAELSLSPEQVSNDSLNAASSPLWNLSSSRLSCLESIGVGCVVSGAEAERGTKDNGALLLGRNAGSSLDHLRLLICIIELFLLLLTLTPQAAGLAQGLWRIQGL